MDQPTATRGAERGSTSRKDRPEASGPFSYKRDGRWGLQVSGDFSTPRRVRRVVGGANSQGSPARASTDGRHLHGEKAAKRRWYNGIHGGVERRVDTSRIRAASRTAAVM